MSDAATDLAAALHGLGVSWKTIREAASDAGLYSTPAYFDSYAESRDEPDYYYIFQDDEND